MKRIVVLALIAAMALGMTACSSQKEETKAEPSQSTEAVLPETATEEEIIMTDDEGFVTEPVTFELSEKGEFKLGDYKNLKAVRYVVTVTDDDVDDYIDAIREENAEYIVVDRGAEQGDIVQVNMTGKVGDEVIYDYSEEVFDVVLGYEDFGSKFDEKLMGAKAGDELTFSISYDEDSYAGAPGETVDFAVTVNLVNEKKIPEIDDEFIASLGYKDEAEMKAAYRDIITQNNEENSNYELRETLFQSVIDNSEFTSYSKELYDAEKSDADATYSMYMEWYGAGTIEELYEMMGMTENDVEAEVINAVARKMVMNAIAEKEKIEVTDEEFNSHYSTLAEELGFESVDELKTEYGEEYLRQILLEEKIGDALIATATVTDEEFTYDESAEGDEFAVIEDEAAEGETEDIGFDDDEAFFVDDETEEEPKE
ncbi:MAG: trigger factor [Clostridia bacterium]|nr:trigger factor [Clostridia bacterium]